MLILALNGQKSVNFEIAEKNTELYGHKKEVMSN
jgi:hypothetical protein